MVIIVVVSIFNYHDYLSNLTDMFTDPLKNMYTIMKGWECDFVIGSSKF